MVVSPRRYDKGATAPHVLPRGAGFRIGAGTRYTKLMLQIHYQVVEPTRMSHHILMKAL